LAVVFFSLSPLGKAWAGSNVRLPSPSCAPPRLHLIPIASNYALVPPRQPDCSRTECDYPEEQEGGSYKKLNIAHRRTQSAQFSSATQRYRDPMCSHPRLFAAVK